jgi:hypothetical protein
VERLLQMTLNASPLNDSFAGRTLPAVERCRTRCSLGGSRTPDLPPRGAYFPFGEQQSMPTRPGSLLVDLQSFSRNAHKRLSWCSGKALERSCPEVPSQCKARWSPGEERGVATRFWHTSAPRPRRIRRNNLHALKVSWEDISSSRPASCQPTARAHVGLPCAERQPFSASGRRAAPTELAPNGGEGSSGGGVCCLQVGAGHAAWRVGRKREAGPRDHPHVGCISCPRVALLPFTLWPRRGGLHDKGDQ